MSGREPAICELICVHCGDGMRFDQQQCETCGERSPRFAVPAPLEFDPRRPVGTTVG